ncbi:hypothetical protein [Cereibacter sphaeroides]|uniref:hypothetical protein n=1 Tax=Cereibacter sphaeroides TaxID=1063 RepID=UPI000F54599D|nr:hypothetical protein [Cereibacter sphaeroides]AZB68198.1 hypothetical protein EBL86_07395 [Cereibacter sphaeroides]
MTVSRRIPPARVRALWADTSRSTQDMAEELGITRQGLSDMARRLGLPKRRTNYEAQKRGSDALFRELWLAGVSCEEIARHLGYESHRGVVQRREMMGLPQRTRGGPRGWRETITMAEFHELQLARLMAAEAEAVRAATKRITA